MDRRCAGALLALAACIASSVAAPTATNNQTELEIHDGTSDGCYYNFQHYGEGDRIMTNEPCLNCTCHNRMLMCYLRVCPFTKPIGQDCTVEKRADQCCPIVTCPDVPVDLLTSTSTSSPAEYGETGLGKLDRYGCSINGKYFPEGSKVPPTPNKPCEHCYCIRNMTTCVMQECTLHVDGCTPIYHKDVCCPVRYSCDHPEDEMPLLDDLSTTVRPTPGFLLTTTTMAPVTQMTQDCVHDDQIFADGALIKTEKACEHCYCMKGDIVCVVQECGTPMENEGKNCTSLPPREGQCCPDTYICEGDELTTESLTDFTTTTMLEDISTVVPPRRTSIEGSGYRIEPDEPYSEVPTSEPETEGSGDEQELFKPDDNKDMLVPAHETSATIHDDRTITEEPISLGSSTTGPVSESDLSEEATTEPDKGENTVPSGHLDEDVLEPSVTDKPEITEEALATKPVLTTESYVDVDTTVPELISTALPESKVTLDSKYAATTELAHTEVEKDMVPSETTKPEDSYKLTTKSDSFTVSEYSTTEAILDVEQEAKITTTEIPELENTVQPEVPTTESTIEPITSVSKSDDDIITTLKPELTAEVTTINKLESPETTSVNPIDNEIDEDSYPAPSPGRIPGEGDCLLNGITYQNESIVPSNNNCHTSCRCVSSIVKCDPIVCSAPPDYMDNCQPVYDSSDSCCPTYVCDHTKETVPPQSHSQMSGTESPVSTPSIECDGDQCDIKKETDQIPTESCESGNCIETVDHSTPSTEPPFVDQSHSTVPSKECSDGKCEDEGPTVNVQGHTTSPAGDCVGGVCDDNKQTSVDQPIPTAHPEECVDGKCQGKEETPIVQPYPTVASDKCVDGKCEGQEQPMIDQLLPTEPSVECVDGKCENKEQISVDQPLPTIPSEECAEGKCPDKEEMFVDQPHPTMPSDDCADGKCADKKQTPVDIPQPTMPSDDCVDDKCTNKKQIPVDQPHPTVPSDGCVDGKCTEETQTPIDQPTHPPSDECIEGKCEEKEHTPVDEIQTMVSGDKCDGGDCETPITKDTTCDSEQGCKVPCQGDECKTEPEHPPQGVDTPICDGGKDCKDTSDLEQVGPHCEGKSCDSEKPSEKEECNTGDCKKPEILLPAEVCDEQGCRKTQIDNVGQPPTSCDGNDCLPQQPIPDITDSPQLNIKPEVTEGEIPAAITDENIIEAITTQSDFTKVTEAPESHITKSESDVTSESVMTEIDKEKDSTSTTEASIPEISDKGDHEPDNIEVQKTPELTTELFDKEITSESYEKVTTISDLNIPETTSQPDSYPSKETASSQLDTTEPTSQDASTEEPAEHFNRYETTTLPSENKIETISDDVDEKEMATVAIEQTKPTEPSLLDTTSKEVDNLDKNISATTTTPDMKEFTEEVPKTTETYLVQTTGSKQTDEESQDMTTKVPEYVQEQDEPGTEMPIGAIPDKDSKLPIDVQDTDIKPIEPVDEIQETSTTSSKDQEMSTEPHTSEPEIVTDKQESIPTESTIMPDNEITETKLSTPEDIKTDVPVVTSNAPQQNEFDDQQVTTTISSDKLSTISHELGVTETTELKKPEIQEPDVAPHQEPSIPVDISTATEETGTIGDNTVPPFESDTTKPTEASAEQESITTETPLKQVTSEEELFTRMPNEEITDSQKTSDIEVGIPLEVTTQAVETVTKTEEKIEEPTKVTPSDMEESEKPQTDLPMSIVKEQPEVSHTSSETPIPDKSEDTTETMTGEKDLVTEQQPTILENNPDVPEQVTESKYVPSDFPATVSLEQSSEKSPEQEDAKDELTVQPVESVTEDNYIKITDKVEINTDTTISPTLKDDVVTEQVVTESEKPEITEPKVTTDQTPVSITMLNEPSSIDTEIRTETPQETTEPQRISEQMDRQTTEPSLAMEPEKSVTEPAVTEQKYTTIPAEINVSIEQDATSQVPFVTTSQTSIEEKEITTESAESTKTPDLEAGGHKEDKVTSVPEELVTDSQHVTLTPKDHELSTLEGDIGSPTEGPEAITTHGLNTNVPEIFTTESQKVETEKPDLTVEPESVSPEYVQTEKTPDQTTIISPSEVITEEPMVKKPLDSSTDTHVQEPVTNVPVTSVTESQKETTEEQEIPVTEHELVTDADIPKLPSTDIPVDSTGTSEIPAEYEKTTKIPERSQTEAIDFEKETEKTAVKEPQDFVTNAPDQITTLLETETKMTELPETITQSSSLDTTVPEIKTESVSLDQESTRVPVSLVTESPEIITSEATEVNIKTEEAGATESPSLTQTEPVIPQIDIKTPENIVTEKQDMATELFTTAQIDAFESTSPRLSGTELDKTQITTMEPNKVETTTGAPHIHETPQELYTEEPHIDVSITDIKDDKKTSDEPELDKMTTVFDESVHTTSPKYEQPETTPYLVELEEHTHKKEIYTTESPDEDIASTHSEPQETSYEQPTEQAPTDNDIQTEPAPVSPEGPEVESVTPEEHTISPESHETTPVMNVESQKITEASLSTEEPTFTSVLPTIESHDDHSTERPQESNEISTSLPVTPEEELKEDEKPVISVDVISDKDTTEKPQEKPMTTSMSEEELIPVTSRTTSATVEQETTTPAILDKITKPADVPSETLLPSATPEVPKPSVNEVHPTDELPSTDDESNFPPSGTGGYGQEPDYGEEDQAFGPGTCRYGGKVYVSAQQIPRDDPCDFCFCFRSDIICLQQSCPPPIHGCHEEPIQGFCCPRYECPVSMATTLNVTTTTTTTTTTLPPHFLPHAYKGAAQRRGCQIKGHTYKVGEVVRASSGPCLHCTCGGDGQMKCDPKVCTPEPMLRQMIAAAVSAKRRR